MNHEELQAHRRFTIRRVVRLVVLIASFARVDAFAQGNLTQSTSNQTTGDNQLPAGGSTTSAPQGAATVAPDPEVIRARKNLRDASWNTKTAPCYAQLNDTIMIDVQDLDEWLRAMKAEGKIKDQTTADLVPFFNGVALWGIHPENPGAASEANFLPGHRAHHFRFTLNRFPADESRNAWSRLLNEPVHNRRIRVSIGFENGVEMPTWVDTTQSEGAYQFFLTVIPTWPSAIGGLIIGGALIIFLLLASQTDIVRDSTAPLRPDGQSPFSLGRVQMAWWFFLIVAAFFTLWVVTRDTDTINGSALTLMGISAGTALGSAIIDAGKNRGIGDIDRYVPEFNLSAKKSDIIHELKQQLEVVQETLASLRNTRSTISPTDQAAIEVNETLQSEAKKTRAILRRQIEFFSWRSWKVVMYDLLADEHVISFHRFQIFVWTIVLGIIFVYKVYEDLAMPDFSSTLLGLLGISAGTYLGFKLPDVPSPAKS